MLINSCAMFQINDKKNLSFATELNYVFFFKMAFGFMSTIRFSENSIPFLTY